MKLIFTCALFLSGCLLFHSSSAKENNDLMKANYYYRHFAYHEAIPYYEKIADQINDWQTYSQLGDCYRLTNSFTKSAECYAKAVKMQGCKDPVFLYYSQVLMGLERYEEAGTWLKEYQKRNKPDKRVANMIAACSSAPKKLRAIPSGTVSLCDFNTDGSEFAPALWRGSLVFTADTVINLKKKTDNWTGNSYYNIYSVTCDANGKCGNEYSEVAKSKNVNIKYHDGPCTFSADGSTMYFTRNRYVTNFFHKKAIANGDTTVLLEIMIASDYDSTKKLFKKITPFQYNSDEYSVAHPTVSPDGNMLIFSSNMPGGIGGTDLYVCRKDNNGEWSKPENAGSLVNTAGEELFPYLADDKTLYFSSDGHEGLGGLDIYVSGLDNKSHTFSTPENIGIPINSSYDDISLALYADGRSSYFSSNRPAAKGGDNIYFYKRRKVYLKLTVIDSITRQPLSRAHVSLLSSKDTLTTQVNNNGQVIKQMFPGLQYKISASDSGYFPKEYFNSYSGNKEVDTISETVALYKRGAAKIFLHLTVKGKDEQPVTGVNVKLEAKNDYRSLEVNSEGVLVTTLFPERDYIVDVTKIECKTAYVSVKTPDNYRTNDTTIYKAVSLLCSEGIQEKDTLDIVVPFSFDRAYLSDTAQERLNSLVDYLTNKHPTYHIKLRAHADCRGNDNYNLKLSQRRAESVRKYLVSRKINASRIDESKGVGESEPKFVCCNCFTTPTDIGRTKEANEKKDREQCNKKAKSVIECSEFEHYQNRYLQVIILKR